MVKIIKDKNDNLDFSAQKSDNPMTQRINNLLSQKLESVVKNNNLQTLIDHCKSKLPADLDSLREQVRKNFQDEAWRLKFEAHLQQKAKELMV